MPQWAEILHPSSFHWACQRGRVIPWVTVNSLCYLIWLTIQSRWAPRNSVFVVFDWKYLCCCLLLNCVGVCGADDGGREYMLNIAQNLSEYERNYIAVDLYNWNLHNLSLEPLNNSKVSIIQSDNPNCPFRLL